MKVLLLIAVLLAPFSFFATEETDVLSKHPRGIIKNDAEPWFILLDDNRRFGCMYFKGYMLFSEGDYVSLVVHPGREIPDMIVSFKDGSFAVGHCVQL